MTIWQSIWLYLTKKLSMFLSRLNEMSGGCEKIAPVSGSFWSNLKFLRIMDLTEWLWGWNVRVNGMRSECSFCDVCSDDCLQKTVFWKSCVMSHQYSRVEFQMAMGYFCLQCLPPISMRDPSDKKNKSSDCWKGIAGVTAPREPNVFNNLILCDASLKTRHFTIRTQRAKTERPAIYD